MIPYAFLLFISFKLFMKKFLLNVFSLNAKRAYCSNIMLIYALLMCFFMETFDIIPTFLGF